MVGAVAGSPGTLPTNNWTATNGGLTQTIVGIGNENGLQYIDLRFNGTANTTAVTILFEGTTNIATLNTQTWTNSFYTKLVASPAPPLTYGCAVSERNSFGGYVADSRQEFTPTTTLRRFTYTISNLNASTAYLLPFYRMALTNGAAYDFTIRIAAPQMELGAYATTFIPTTTAAVTRLVDTFSHSNIYTNGFISDAGGTWFVDLSNNLTLQRSANNGIFIGDSTTINTSNQLVIRNGVANGIARYAIFKYVSGTPTTLSATPITNNVKIAIKWNGTTADVFVNGIKEASATSFTTTLMENLIGSGSSVPFFINQSALFPAPLTDEECITITTL
jgi:hypothetical protein